MIMMRPTTFGKLTATIGITAALLGCSSVPKSESIPVPPPNANKTAPPLAKPEDPSVTMGRRITLSAQSLIGIRYQWGGSSPQAGFDCSGLVYYTMKRHGIKTPRSSRHQAMRARKIDRSAVTPGDLYFFEIEKNKGISHVGIVLNAKEGKFIHAPKSGGHVSVASLQNPYWRQRLAMVGRLH